MLLASLIVFAYAHAGIFILGMLVALFFLYIWLMRELLLSPRTRDQLDERGRQLASLQVGVLTAMLKTLALRDHMTARHSAAVARYRARPRPVRPAARRTSRTSSTPRACCTTSASSSSPTASSWPTRA